MNNWNGSKLKSNMKLRTTEEALEALFQNDYANFNSSCRPNSIHKSDSNISINSDYNEKSRSQHVHNRIISKPVP